MNCTPSSAHFGWRGTPLAKQAPASNEEQTKKESEKQQENAIALENEQTQTEEAGASQGSTGNGGGPILFSGVTPLLLGAMRAPPGMEAQFAPVLQQRQAAWDTLVDSNASFGQRFSAGLSFGLTLLAGPEMAFMPMPATITSSAASAAVRATGQAGEAQGLRLFSQWLGQGVVKNTEMVSHRVPDVLLRGRVGLLAEIKYREYLAATGQIRHYSDIARQLKLDFALMVRVNTRLSGPLLEMQARGEVMILKWLP